MAVNADSVVVEVEARLGDFNSQVRQGAAQFDQSMDSIAGSASKAEKVVTDSHAKISLAGNQSRIAMLELQHVVRGSTDQFASGAPISQIFAQHIASVGEAAALAGGSLGAVGELLSGPWGLAIVAGTSLLATLIFKHHEAGESVDSLVEKLKKHAEHTALSERADDIWAHTIDGLIDRSKKLNEQIERRITNQTELNKRTLQGAQNDFTAATTAAARLENTPGTTQEQLDKAQQAIHASAIALHDAQVAQGRDLGAAASDLAAFQTQWSETQESIIKEIQRVHPELAEKGIAAQISAAFDVLKKASQDAAGAGVGFDNIVHRVNALNNALAADPQGVKSYIANLKALAAQLEATAAAAKNPIQTFQQAVFGVEGTGKNALGSSAAGFGQFMPRTFETYFRQLYPTQASGMSNAQIDEERNNRQVATAVLDAATKDYVAALKSSGQAITAANLYIEHVLGGPDAKKLFAAAPGASLASVFGASRASLLQRQNPGLILGTVGATQDAFAKRIGQGSSSVSAGAEALVRQQQQEQEREAAFAAERSTLEGKVIEARKALLIEAIDSADAEKQAIEKAREKYDAQVDALVTAKKLLPEEGRQLKAINDQYAELRTQLADRTEAEIRLKQQEEAFSRARDFQDATAQSEEELLRSNEALAQTSDQRKAIEDRLINLQFEEERLRQQYLVDWAARVQANENATDKEKADAALAGTIAQLHLDTLPQRQANTVAANHIGPAAQFFASLPSIHDSIETNAVDAVKGLNDELLKVADNTETVGQGFHNMANLILQEMEKIALQELLIKPLASLLGGGGGGFSSLLSLFGIGGGGGGGGAAASALFGGGDPTSLASTVSLLGFANGGSVRGGVPIMVGERGKEMFVPSSDGAIIPNKALGNGGVVEVRVYAGEGFDTQVLRVSGPVIARAAVQAARGGSLLARKDISTINLHRLD